MDHGAAGGGDDPADARVKRHYVRVNREIDLDRPFVPAEVSEPIVVVPVDRWSRISEKALSFALSMSCDIRCVHVQTSDDPDPFCDAWEKDIVAPLKAAGRCIPKLVTLKSPYRYILHPIVDYVLKVERETRPARCACWCRNWWCAHGGRACCTTAAPTC
jgi:hypothetical protein